MPAASTPGELHPSIVLHNGDGKSSTAFTGYTYTRFNQSPPSIMSINPATGPTIGGTYVQIVGNNFSSSVIVKFGGMQATT